MNPYAAEHDKPVIPIPSAECAFSLDGPGEDGKCGLDIDNLGDADDFKIPDEISSIQEEIDDSYIAQPELLDIIPSVPVLKVSPKAD